MIRADDADSTHPVSCMAARGRGIQEKYWHPGHATSDAICALELV